MKRILIVVIMIFVAGSALLFNGCAPTKSISERTGAQLWGENCNRCHNAPTMDQYTKDHWEVIGTHMRIRANVTDMEVKKIVGFLQGEN